jgi:hypothetical protein
MISKRRIDLLAGLAFAAIAVWHFHFVCATAVDIPEWDEWDLLADLVPHPTPAWVFRYHNEHRIVLTKVQVLLHYAFDHWNVAHQQIGNFVIFVGLLILVVGAIRRVSSDMPVWLALLSSGVCLSTLPIQNHTWAFQSGFHFFLLFAMLAQWLLWTETATLPRLLVAAGCLLLSAYSFGAGVGTAAVIAVAYVLYRVFVHSERQPRWAYVAAFAAIVGLGLALWFVPPPPRGLEATYPWEWRFWSFMLQLLTLGVGQVEPTPVRFAVAIAVLILAPVSVALASPTLRAQRETWFLASTLAALIGALVVVTHGRAVFGDLGAKASRYGEIAMLIVPVTVHAYWLVMRRFGSRVQTSVAAAMAVLSFVGFADDWRFSAYAEVEAKRQQFEKCVRAELVGHQLSTEECGVAKPPRYDHSLPNAVKLQLSFVRRARRDIPTTTPAARRR